MDVQTCHKRINIENIDEIVQVELEDIKVNLIKLRAIQSDLENLKGTERKYKSNFIKATLNLTGLNNTVADISKVVIRKY